MKRLVRFFERCNLAIMLLFTGLFFANQSIGQGVVINPASPWSVPPGVTQVKVEVWGGGGGGGGSLFGNAAGGGGGGAYNSITWSANSTQSYTITIGNGGASGADGGITTVTGPLGSISANPGKAGGGSSFLGNGGSGAGGTGGIHSGGAGGAGSGNSGGGGGGAGNNGDGGPGSTSGAGTGGAGSPANSPYIGGNGGGPISASGNGINASATGPGGGGGGAKGTGNGGTGGAGQVVITYTCPTATISYTAPDFCKSITSAPATITGSTGGTFTATPGGLTINSSTGAVNPSTSAAATYTVHYQFAAANGCPAVDATASVKINATPVSSATGTNITCVGANDGTITVSATGGTSPYTFSINNGVNFFPATGTDSRLFTGLAPNVAFTIKVKDANTCISK